MVSTCLILTLLTTAVLVDCYDSTDSEWREWKQKYQKVYSNHREEIRRRQAWETSRRFVEQHNNRVDVTFKTELNSRADLFVGESPTTKFYEVKNSYVINDVVQPPPPYSFDWRTKGVVPQVRNQGSLGNPGVFAATDSVESLLAITTGKLQSLSYQEVADCCSASHLWSPNIFDCIHNIGGLCLEAQYPNVSGVPICRNISCNAVAKIKGGRIVSKGNEYELLLAVLMNPVMAGIDASHSSFQLYKSGVYDDPDCTDKIDHIVLIVGYGVMNGKEYWIVKNSWGSEWGMNGYILMSRNKHNQCGIATMASYPLSPDNHLIKVMTGVWESSQEMN